METWPEAHRYRGVKRVLRHEFGWYRGRISLSSQQLGRRVFFCPETDKILNFWIRSMSMKAQLEAIRSAALEAIAGTGARAELEAVRVQYLD